MNRALSSLKRQTVTPANRNDRYECVTRYAASSILLGVTGVTDGVQKKRNVTLLYLGGRYVTDNTVARHDEGRARRLS